MKKILIIGGNGLGISVAEFIEECSEYQVLGYLNDFEKIGTVLGSHEVVGTCSDWKRFGPDCYFVYTLHRFCSMQERYKKLKQLQISIDKFPNIVHPQTYISKSSKINGFGTIIFPFAAVQHHAVIGSFCSIRSGANIGHDCHIGEFNYIGPNAVLSGFVQTQEGVYIAPNVTVNSSVTLHQFSMAGSNSVIYKDIAENLLYQGNPSRCMGKANE